MTEPRISDEGIEMLLETARKQFDSAMCAALLELRERRAYQRIERLERITDRIAYEDDKDADHGK